MIRIDFENTFEPVEIAEDLSFMIFYSPDKDGDNVLIKVKIQSLKDPLLPAVYNLAFGPYIPNAANPDEDIDDVAKIKHTDTNKMFSTVLFFGLVFLQANPDFIIGIDGSTETRAYLYHRMFQTNINHLNEYFVTIGVDWYVRLLRNNNIEVDRNGSPFFKPKPEPFDIQRPTTDLYRYYMFHLRK